MIKCDEYTLNGVQFKHWYSDAGMKVEREGVLYDTADDPAEYGRTYNETDIPIETLQPTDEDYAEAGKIMMGADE